MLDALEARVGQAVRSTCQSTLSWLVEYASVLWNRYAVSADGKTAHERLRGKKSRVLGLEFGEKVLWRRAVVTGHRTNKLDSIWAEGVYLGHRTISGESMVGNKDGIFKSRSIRRVPVEDRWHYDLLHSLGGTPWKVNPQAEESDQVIQDDVKILPSATPEVPVEPPHALFREEAPRKVYVKTGVLKEIGYTPGCLGCQALQSGRTRVGHNDQCRKRAVDTMKETILGRERLTAARKREDEFLARAVQHSDEKRQKVESTAVPSSTSMSLAGGSSSGYTTVSVPVQHSMDMTMDQSGPSSSTSIPIPTTTSSSSSSAMEHSIPVVKRPREDDDEGDQDVHLSGDQGRDQL